MDEEAFAALAYRLWDQVPPHFKERIQNVALLIEDEPDEEVRALEGLEGDDTLLGLYRGIPNTERGEGYGVGMVLPDTITLYRLPIIEEAEAVLDDDGMDATPENLAASIHLVLAETLWHEVGHYFGLSEDEIHEREEEGTNAFGGRIANDSD